MLLKKTQDDILENDPTCKFFPEYQSFPIMTGKNRKKGWCISKLEIYTVSDIL